jgi:integrase
VTGVVLPLPLPTVERRRWERVAEGIFRRGKVIVLDFEAHGHQVHRRLGKVSVTEARRIAAELRADLARRTAGVGPAPSSVSVAEVVAGRLGDREGKIAPRTAVRYAEMRRHLDRLMGSIEARTVSAEDVRRYQETRKEEGATPTTINKEVCLLRASLRAGVREGRLERDPFYGIDWRLPEPELGSAARVLSDEEIGKMIEVAEPWFGRFIAVANSTGCRAGELTAARIEDVDLIGRTITFRAETVKGRRGKRRSRRIYLNDAGLAAVQAAIDEARAAGSSFLFPAPRDPSRPVRSDAPARAWRLTLRRAGLRHARFHDIRHSFITRLVRKGVSPSIVRRIVGHTTTQMIDQIYAHLAPDEVAAAVLADG